ncbi:MAG TPA: MerR family transcriptional regulator [Candidatus Lachnoclostridium stercorigallinarum]|uniref:MerR family transcriptional regulator n=1 Tax=Candidatus Lachnoclostridium stercorigallinarum TaxID=2838634 RepID=A0A9D2GIH4_9FIRM|nr:MerR family transcriptional regulator [Candidatus Lachnoclostridium stercorigallinarum]
MTIKEVSEKFDIPQGTLRYYEKVGLIPRVTRSSGGIRNYQESDLGWVELAKCMRGAGLSVEVLLEYVQLCQQGDSTIPDRLSLLKEQKDHLLQQKEQIEAALNRLNYKISRYEVAVKTGVLDWGEN